MPHRVDAAVESVEPASRRAAPDRTRSVTELLQLPGRDHAVLLFGQLGDLPVTWTI
jgi:hypothetical protein